MNGKGGVAMKQEALLRAIGEIDEEMIWAAKKPTERRGMRRSVRVGLIAAAAAALCLATAWAVVSGAGVRLVDREDQERMALTGAEEMGVDIVPGAHFSDMDQQTVDEYLRDLTRGVAGEIKQNGRCTWREAVGAMTIEQAEDPDFIKWDHFLYAEAIPTFSAIGERQNDFHPDLSWLERTLTPVEGTFIYAVDTRRPRGSADPWEEVHAEPGGDEEVYDIWAQGTYRTASGGALTVSFDYLPTLRQSELMLSADSYDFREQVTSADGTAFELFGVGSNVYGYLYLPHGNVNLTGVGCTREEVRQQIEHMDLGDIPAVFSVGAER